MLYDISALWLLVFYLFVLIATYEQTSTFKSTVLLKMHRISGLSF